MVYQDLFPPKIDLSINYSASNQIGNKLAINGRDGIPSHAEIAIIGIVNGDDNMPDAFRQAFYELYDFGMSQQVYDAGNFWLVNEKSKHVVAQLLLLLKKQFKLVVVLSSEFNNTWLEELVSTDEHVTWVHTACQAAINSIEQLELKAQRLNKINLLGYQSYLTDASVLYSLEKEGHEHIRLGELNHDLAAMEPFFRESDSVLLSLNSVQNAYTPKQNSPQPNGLSGTSFCTLARFAGAGSRVGHCFITDSQAQIDTLTARFLAQTVWYLLEGYSLRIDEDPLETSAGCIKYITDLKTPLCKLIFFESKRSKRWWMYLPLEDEAKLSRAEYLIPCTINDYNEAMQGDIPERWIKAVGRLGSVK